ncbi:MAG: hypothetical protein ACRCUY_04175, partial [Thermoguttaceae bacterium]
MLRLFYFLTNFIIVFALNCLLLTIGIGESVRAAGQLDNDLTVRFAGDRDIFTVQSLVHLEILPFCASHSRLSDGLSLHVSVYAGITSPLKSLEPSRLSLWRSETISKSLVSELEILVPPGEISKWIPVSLLAPSEEGIYEMRVELLPRIDKTSPSLWTLPQNRLVKRGNKPLAESTLQILVVDPQKRERKISDWSKIIKREIVENKDSPPSFWQKGISSLPALPSLPKMGSLPIPLLPATKVGEKQSKYGFREQNTGIDIAEAEEKNDALAEKDSLSQDLEHLSGKNQIDLNVILESFSRSQNYESKTWTAFPLTVHEEGKPHLLEWDYSISTRQKIGFGIVEMLSKNGIESPHLTANSGIFVSESIDSLKHDDQMRTHRILFWPKTKEPLLLVVGNESKDISESFRLFQLESEAISNLVFQADSESTSQATPNTASILSHKKGLPKPFGNAPKRLFACYIEQSDILETLSSSAEWNVSDSSRPLSDWQTLYEGGTRLIDFLQVSGFDGILIKSVSNEAALFSSEKWATQNLTTQNLSTQNLTPLISDVHSSYSAQSFCSAPKKDALEMLSLLFDRENLRLIPGIKWNMTLNAVEQFRQQHPDQSGDVLQRTHLGTLQYNPLHPVVQQAMLEVVREMVQKYGTHSSFGGIAILLTPDGFGHLSHSFQLIDDWTFRQFANDYLKQKISTPEKQQEVSQILDLLDSRGEINSDQLEKQRVEMISAHPQLREQWMRWRCEKLRLFYTEMANTVTEIRPDTALILSAATLLRDPVSEQMCVQTLPRRITPAHLLLWSGFDMTAIAQIPSIQFLRPSWITSEDCSDTWASYCDFDSKNFSSFFENSFAGISTIFYHESFHGFMLLPSAEQSRRRFTHQLAQSDIRTFFDGGERLGNGNESAILDLLATFRELPGIPFQTHIDENAPESHQPLTVRIANTETETYMYIVNDSPFSISAEISLNLPHGTIYTELSGARKVSEIVYNQQLCSLNVS